MLLSREVALHSSDFDVESFLGLCLCYRADAQADPNPEKSLIDESSAVRKNSDARCACRGHELLLCGAEEHFRTPPETMKRVGSVRGGFNHGRPLLQGANLSGLVGLKEGNRQLCCDN